MQSVAREREGNHVASCKRVSLLRSLKLHQHSEPFSPRTSEHDVTQRSHERKNKKENLGHVKTEHVSITSPLIIHRWTIRILITCVKSINNLSAPKLTVSVVTPTLAHRFRPSCSLNVF